MSNNNNNAVTRHNISPVGAAGLCLSICLSQAFSSFLRTGGDRITDDERLVISHSVVFTLSIITLTVFYMIWHDNCRWLIRSPAQKRVEFITHFGVWAVGLVLYMAWQFRASPLFLTLLDFCYRDLSAPLAWVAGGIGVAALFLSLAK